jgi:heterogeneous nuclear ribonucleoprotein U-like protein 1
MKLEDVKTGPEIIVMVGLPGSGKSTWSDNMLANSPDSYVVVSSDDELERMADHEGISYGEAHKKYIGKAVSISKQKFREAVNKGENIIWDQVNLSPKKRRSILNQVPASYKKTAVAFEVTASELNQRLAKREQETGKHIPPHVMKNMAKTYRPPTKEEGFDNVIFV